MVFYAVFGLIGARILLARWPELYNPPSRAGEPGYAFIQRKHMAWINAFLDALFLLWLIVMIQDSIWLLFNTWKWILPLYSGVATFWNYYVRFAENLLGFMLFGLLTYGKFQLGVASFNLKTLYCLVGIAAFTFTVFFLAPNQAWSDWTFAVSRGFPDQVILDSFLISHVGYKSLITLAFLSLILQKPKFKKS